MIPLIEKELLKREWISSDELQDIIVLAQSAPGLLAVNMAIYTGYRLAGFKGSVVAQDEKDNGVRRTLNMGHTAGHAIEKCAGFTITHGHAVAIGMVLIARAAEKLGWCEEPCAERIAAVLRRNHLPTSTEYTAKELAEAALSDKKRRGGTISLVIPRRIGDCYMKTIPVTELEAVFAAGLEG